MNQPASKGILGTSAKLGASEKLSARTTPELVIGLVGPVASGVSTTAKILQHLLEDDYNYRVHTQTVSGIIRSSAPLVGMAIGDGSEETPDQRVSIYQTAGNKLRERLGSGYLAAKCVEEISRLRAESGTEKSENPGVPDQPKPLRVAHIIDSIKNPAEVEQFQQVYGRMFWLFAVFAPENIRKERLKAKGCVATFLDNLIQCDQDQDVDFGQKVRDTIDRADFFLRNDRSNDVTLKKNLTRYLEILFHYTIHTPTADECAMYEAQAAAANSACMSRQVGAAIYSKANELLSIGWNDVPKAGGGLYRTEDRTNDHRCFKWGDKICHNDANKNKIQFMLYKDLNATLVAKWKAEIQQLKLEVGAKQCSDKDFWKWVQVRIASLENKGGLELATLKQAAKRSGIDSLIEFSRAVHAEMEAIIAALRSGDSDLQDATLYCTTFPCHSCARHIVASGIKRVVYIEPYPKSKAYELHNDSIHLEDGIVNSDKVSFVQYEGVAPKNMLALFKSNTLRKDKVAGKFIERTKRSLQPLFTPPMDGFAANEKLVVRALADTEREIGQAASHGA